MRNLIVAIFIIMFYSTTQSQVSIAITADDEIFFVSQNVDASDKPITYTLTAQTQVIQTNRTYSYYGCTISGYHTVSYSTYGESSSLPGGWHGLDWVASVEDADAFAYAKYKIQTNDVGSDYFYIDYRDCNFAVSGYNINGRDMWIKYDDSNNHFYYSASNPTNISNGWSGPISNGATLTIWGQKGVTRSIDCFSTAPTNVVADTSGGHPFITWDHSRLPNGQYVYEVWRKIEGSPFFSNVGQTQNVNYYIDYEIGIGEDPDLIARYKVRAKLDDMASDFSNVATIYFTDLLKEQSNTNLKDGFETLLMGNHPNPFNPITNISYSLSQDGFVSLKVYNSIGKEVITLINDYQSANDYSVPFNASNLPSGIYFYTLTTGNYTSTKKMLLIK